MSRLHDLTRPLLLAAGVAFLLALPFELYSAVLADGPFQEIAQTGPHAASATLVLVGFLLLGLSLPGLAAIEGKRRLATPAVVLAMLGCFSGVTLQWYIAVVIPWQARSSAPELAGELGGVGFYVLLGAFTVGTFALAIGCLRSGVVSRAGGVLLLLAGLCAPVSVVFLPVLGVALIVSGRSVTTGDRHRDLVAA